MPPFAYKTKIPVDKTRLDIERLVKKYGAKGFISGWHGAHARIEFLCRDRLIRMTVQTPESATSEREKWRALLFVVKARLVAVDSKIATFEEAFLGDIVLPETGKTVWETAREPIKLQYEGKSATLLMSGPRP